jgi:hypothetical protein
MKKVYLTERQFNQYLHILSEEEYCQHFRLGPFANEVQAQSELERIRNEMGFSEYDSWIDGNFVVLELENSKYDSDYVGDMIAAIKKQYGQVAESRD